MISYSKSQWFEFGQRFTSDTTTPFQKTYFCNPAAKDIEVNALISENTRNGDAVYSYRRTGGKRCERTVMSGLCWLVYVNVCVVTDS